MRRIARPNCGLHGHQGGDARCGGARGSRGNAFVVELLGRLCGLDYEGVMIRTSTLVVLLSLLGAPAVATACGLWCGTGMQHGASIGHRSDHAGAHVGSVHACAHVPAAGDIFVPTKGRSSASSVIASLNVETPGLHSQAHPVSTARVARWWPPPGGRIASLLVRTSVLRI